MYDGENGMVLAGARLLEAVREEEDVLGDMSDHDVVRYIFEKGRELDVFAQYLGLPKDVRWDEDNAYDSLSKLIDNGVEGRFSAWAHNVFSVACREYIENDCNLLNDLKWGDY